MSKINIPQTFAEAEEQPGTTVTLQRDGLATVVATFGFDWAAIGDALQAVVGSVHPRFTWAGFQAGRLVEEPGELAMLQVTYQGDPTGSNFEFDPELPEPAIDPPRFSLSWMESEEPILTAERYRDIDAGEKAAVLAIISSGDLDAQNAEGQKWRETVTSSLGQEVLNKIADGTTGVKVPRLVWRAGYTSDTIPRAAFRRRGKILPPWGPAPTFTDGTNWRLAGGEIVQAGSTNTIDLVWEASGPGGWDPDLYS